MTDWDPRLRDTFIQLVDTLVDDFDVIEFLDTLTLRCAELLDVATCGLLLADHNGTLNMVAASTEQTRLLELFQLQNSEGPCLDCFRSGQPVSCADLAKARERWPRFTGTALKAGFTAVHAMPMRLRSQSIGALNLFSTGNAPLAEDALALGQALADVATVGILHQRVVRRHEVVTAQLQTALNSRVLIEQAKGVLAERRQISVDEAFVLLRAHARSRNRKLLAVARDVVEGNGDLDG